MASAFIVLIRDVRTRRAIRLQLLFCFVKTNLSVISPRLHSLAVSLVLGVDFGWGVQFGYITGRFETEKILDVLFAEFCIGK